MLIMICGIYLARDRMGTSYKWKMEFAIFRAKIWWCEIFFVTLHHIRVDTRVAKWGRL